MKQNSRAESRVLLAALCFTVFLICTLGFAYRVAVENQAEHDRIYDANKQFKELSR